MDGLIALNKTNLFHKAHSFHVKNHEGQDTTLAGTVAEMCNSLKFRVAPTVLMTSSGQMREEAAELYWEHTRPKPPGRSMSVGRTTS